MECGQMNKGMKGIGWFILELYTPTPPEVTTNMEVDIDKIAYQRSIINKCTNRNVKIITEINEQMKIDVRTNSDVIIETKTNIIERNIK